MLKILIVGLPGAGKTTLAGALASLPNAIVFNADAVRENLSRDLGFCHADRVERVRRVAVTSDTRSNALCSTRQLRRFPRPMCVASAVRREALRAAIFDTAEHSRRLL